jgi:hypothetical protein
LDSVLGGCAGVVDLYVFVGFRTRVAEQVGADRYPAAVQAVAPTKTRIKKKLALKN